MDKVTAAELGSLVDAVCISGVEGVAKPDPWFLQIAAERAGAPLKNSWMIGDNRLPTSALHTRPG